jgi:protein-L-isoaspartate(D-aspartate) O-methyltransferase
VNDPFEAERKEMVNLQLKTRSIHSSAVLNAMQEVSRHFFVPEDMRRYSYSDGPLSIGQGQTISQPYIVALMIQAADLAPTSTVLEIGTGSGYAAAVLSRTVKEVYTIERLPDLAQQAEKILKKLHYTNVHVKTGDGTLGWPEKGPYDAIIVTAGAPVVPESFINQLKTDGKVLIPVGDETSQQLLRLRKLPSGKYTQEIVEYVRFVPLIGEQGWHERQSSS